ncbi:hypothetical protein [Hoyosella altamirensis]|uniref:Secreted protein n=1 Tax=Hoyosella altamirensis TaxID=616997 RepID=A0A839RKA7_9ACTN|nr:hypothetical protein [Hoyosella altamirensis]MBB3036890.1 hypothetical protein [Hoyosella altamirensis]
MALKQRIGQFMIVGALAAGVTTGAPAVASAAPEMWPHPHFCVYPGGFGTQWEVSFFHVTLFTTPCI